MAESFRKNFKQKNALDWEEAGGEFYQETYSSEWEGFPTDNVITTLLPSKQNRLGTCRRIQRDSKDTKPNKYWQPIPTTKRNTYKNNELQNSLLPDLSEVLTDEGRIWEEILQIKLIPVPMEQKKELKIKLQNATKLRLQGFNQFKWKHRKIWQRLRLSLTELFTKMQLWHSSLKKIEGNYGTGITSYFLFIRWLFVLNTVMFVFVLLFLILPNIFWLNSSEPERDNVFPVDDHYSSSNVVDIIKGTGLLKNTYIFYGAYSNVKMSAENFYDFSLAYFFIFGLNLLISLFAILKNAYHEFKDRIIYGKWQNTDFCNLAFSGWDFCIHNKNSAQIKHKAIFNEIKYLLLLKYLEYKRRHRTKNYVIKLTLSRIVVNIIILMLLSLFSFMIYFLLNISLQNQLIEEGHGNSSYILEYSILNFQHIFKHSFDDHTILMLFLAYAPYILIICSNLILPTFFNYFSKFEKYSPLYTVKINLLRISLLRFVSLAILLSQFYLIVSTPNGNYAKDEHGCWETFVGCQFYKLILTDFICHVLLTFCINFPRALCAKNVKHDIITHFGEQDFDLPKHILDVVYMQTICWLSSFFAPVIHAVLAIAMFFMFYIKKFQCLVNSNPSKLLYGSTRCKSISLIVLLLSYLIVLLPVIYVIAVVTPSSSCGPFGGLQFVWDAPMTVFLKMPQFLKDILLFLGTAKFAIPSLILLLFCAYYFYAVSEANKKLVNILRNQLVLEGHDKQFLLTRLSVFLKQQHNSHEQNLKPDECKT
ncbi:transmembrane channel-like protein 7 isoform X1 [Teleopsis dalmanni]|uniref:transmembrane channel-like protein 7 isoform X1 n=1 Tax=Teleopsis dalmanni TaxID=139649 RepID=UPI0018CF1C7B|nr:transmembrane channel-like protein 7 isoform X1 [Teleopsis dalmanni]